MNTQRLIDKDLKLMSGVILHVFYIYVRPLSAHIALTQTLIISLIDNNSSAVKLSYLTFVHMFFLTFLIVPYVTPCFHEKNLH